MEATIQQTNNSLLSIIISLIITLFAIFAIYNISHTVPATWPAIETTVMQWSSDTISWTSGWSMMSN